MITEKKPDTWQDLQEWCAQILRECGWKTDTEVKVDLARGQAEIDVLATEIVQGREYKILIECKNWANRVPQSIVHSFRTVVADFGANTGYIVSKSGFQSGAYRAAEYTNVELLTWSGFQEALEVQWYWEYLTKYVVRTLEPLGDFLEPMPISDVRHWGKYLDHHENDRLIKLYNDNCHLPILILELSPYIGMMKGNSAKVDLPISKRLKACGNFPESLLRRTGYREFIQDLEEYCAPILQEFQEFRELVSSRRDSCS